MQLKKLSLILFALLCSLIAIDSEARTWTSSKSKTTLKAKFISFDGSEVCLQKKDGKLKELPLRALSSNDQNYIYANIIKLTSPHSRSWTQKGTSKTIFAKFIKSDRSNVTIRYKNGKKVNIPLSSFSSVDIKYVYKVNARKKPSRSKTLIQTSSAKYRNWKLKFKSKKLQGKLVGYNPKQITIQTSRAKTSLPVSSLSSNDNYYVQSKLKRAYRKSKANRSALVVAKNSTPKKTKTTRRITSRTPPIAISPSSPSTTTSKPKEIETQDSNTASISPSKTKSATTTNIVPKKRRKYSYTPPAKRSSSNPYSASNKSIYVVFFVMLLFNSLVYTGCLYASMMITRCDSSFPILLVASVIGGLVAAIIPIPFANAAIAGVVQLGVIKVLSKTSIIDTLFLVLVANFFYMVVAMIAIAKLMKMIG